LRKVLLVLVVVLLLVVEDDDEDDDEDEKGRCVSPPKPHNDWRSLYPFASQFAAVGDPRMHFVDEGAGEPLLMVHGNPTWSFYWRNLIQAWRGRFRVVAPDHIGCGLSDKPQHYPYSLRQHIENLATLVEQLDLRGVTLLAHDWGGAIGLGTALRLPERFARIVLFNTGAFPPPFVPKRIALCRLPLLGTLAIRGLNLFARAALTMAVEKPDRMTPSVRAGLLAPYDSWANRVAIQRFVADIPFTPRHPTWQVLAGIESGLPTLASRPIQLIWGMRDWCFTTACLERLRQSFPRAEVHRLLDAGHYVVEDAHERIVPLVEDFLRRSAGNCQSGK
jgi:haloalkane dehalogenase